MTRHPFRWESLAFGLFFLAVVGNWAVWERDLLTPRELSLTASAVLILLGLIGIAATVRQTRPTPHTTSPTSEGVPDEEADPQH
ncbi:hypothetical protein GEV29_07220 [Aeromicrobium sp. SMF47]|uniref:Uncharacterized protein n=1 Tax=Aeromicrobium yanjiei TaxID=2662028 RepID=A0A5Q2MIK0_9ACTN|nr:MULTISPECIES: hypothetical protein [Aeromicrobium]MRJ76322.1 hypothetical protein [Aeromicrobium yanjiei]MRK00673.1 hypothetical protein [Aeromicrobium sp. S22]QGG42498.1 hypothetical protein GEV26_14560 [Aeromicrobium yanjiei]